MQVVSSAVCWCQITEKRDWQAQQKSVKVVTNDDDCATALTAGEVSLKLK